jgi:hypothetical protein
MIQFDCHFFIERYNKQTNKQREEMTLCHISKNNNNKKVYQFFCRTSVQDKSFLAFGLDNELRCWLLLQMNEKKSFVRVNKQFNTHTHTHTHRSATEKMSDPNLKLDIDSFYWNTNFEFTLFAPFPNLICECTQIIEFIQYEPQ